MLVSLVAVYASAVVFAAELASGLGDAVVVVVSFVTMVDEYGYHW